MYKRTWMFSASRNCIQILGGPCGTMLHPEVMVMDEWHNGGPRDLLTVSPCIQNTVDKNAPVFVVYKIHLPTHNPGATMGRSIHNADVSKPLTHTKPYTRPSAPYSDTRIHPWREHLSKVPDAIECEHWPTQVSYANKLWSGLDPDEDGEHADELLRHFDCAEMLCTPITAVAVWSAGLRQSWR